MKILGIDPGTARMGWAIIEAHANRISTLSYGCLETYEKDDPGKRLFILYTELTKLCKKYNPQAVALEEIFFTTNAKTVIPVAQARGVVLLTATAAHIPVISYSPLAVKLAITGSGKADKTQIQRMVMLTLKLQEVPKPDDAADALAIAMTHAYSYKMKSV